MLRSGWVLTVLVVSIPFVAHAQNPRETAVSFSSGIPTSRAI